MKHYNYIISGGGTGGHIYPAIAIARELQLLRPDAKIIFVGALGKMEMEKVPQAGFSIHGLWISGLHRGQLWRNILFPLQLMVSFFHAFILWWRYRPATVIGTGGFASGPMGFVSSLMGSKIVLQEQNSYAGITNKLLASKADCVAVAYSGMEKYFPAHKIILTGNPVRSSLIKAKYLKKEAIDFFKLNPNKKTLLILGGSLGASAINQLIDDHLDFFRENRLQLIWQCGKSYFDQYQSRANENVQVLRFIHSMDMAYAAADFIISRAGAASISEISVVGKPTLLIPSPNVAENHQYHNAMALVNENAACLVEESKLETFKNVFLKLLNDEKYQQALVDNLKVFARPKATQEIVSRILNIQ